MKRTHIIGLFVIAAAVAVLISVAGDYNQYANFSDVIAKPNVSHQIVGHLVVEEPIVYNPKKDPNYFSFFMRDDNNMVKQVVYKGPKPQDFERSEQIVLNGRLEGDVFVARNIMLKCPSKYKDEQTNFASNS